MKLEVNEKRFSIKYAVIYTLLFFSILFVPFAIYAKYLYSIKEVKTEISLKEKALQIIDTMEQFDPKTNHYFEFPRYKLYQAGLYDKNGNPVFTLIDHNISVLDLKPGYHAKEPLRIYVSKLPENRYFHANYLVVATAFDIYAIWVNLLIIFFLLLIITFLFSFTILRNFAKPFKQINETLDEFIKDAMHEINTPLSIININIDIFTEKFGKNKYLSRIKSASKILSSIYNDMNYLIKEQTISKARRELIDFSAFLKRSTDYFQDIAELKNIKLVTDIEENIKIYFIPAKLQKIVDNNLSNAIKYSHENSQVIITLKKEANITILGFRDFGIGIKDTELIFSRYYREDNTKGGFGLGLNIVGKIIQEENIDVTIESTPKGGSYFEYRFKGRSKLRFTTQKPHNFHDKTIFR